MHKTYIIFSPEVYEDVGPKLFPKSNYILYYISIKTYAVFMTEAYEDVGP